MGTYLTEEDIDSLDSSILKSQESSYIRSLGDSCNRCVIDPDTDNILGGFKLFLSLYFNSGYKLRRISVWCISI